MEGSALNFLGLGLGLMLGWAAFLSPAGVMSLSPAYHEDRRQQRLAECMQGARELKLADACRWVFDTKYIEARRAEAAEEARERAERKARAATAVWSPLSPEECARIARGEVFDPFLGLRCEDSP